MHRTKLLTYYFKKITIFPLKNYAFFKGVIIVNNICRRCLSSYTSQNVLIKQKPQCEQEKIIHIRTSNESHFYWNKHFHKNSIYFRIVADSEAENEIAYSSIRNKTTSINKQSPALTGYVIVSELKDVLKRGYNQSPLGYDDIEWFVDEVIKLENKLALY